MNEAPTTEPTPGATPSDGPLPFYWDRVDELLIVRDKRGSGCHPADHYEKLLIEEIERLRAELAARQ